MMSPSAPRVVSVTMSIRSGTRADHVNENQTAVGLLMCDAELTEPIIQLGVSEEVCELVAVCDTAVL